MKLWPDLQGNILITKVYRSILEWKLFLWLHWMITFQMFLPFTIYNELYSKLSNYLCMSFCGSGERLTGPLSKYFSFTAILPTVSSHTYHQRCYWSAAIAPGSGPSHAWTNRRDSALEINTPETDKTDTHNECTIVREHKGQVPVLNTVTNTDIKVKSVVMYCIFIDCT